METDSQTVKATQIVSNEKTNTIVIKALKILINQMVGIDPEQAILNVAKSLYDGKFYKDTFIVKIIAIKYHPNEALRTIDSFVYENVELSVVTADLSKGSVIWLEIGEGGLNGNIVKGYLSPVIGIATLVGNKDADKIENFIIEKRKRKERIFALFKVADLSLVDGTKYYRPVGDILDIQSIKNQEVSEYIREHNRRITI